MKTKFKEVAHLYLHVKVMYDGRIGNICQYYLPAGKYKTDEVWVASLEDSEDEEMSCSVLIDKVKPILRPLSDMSEEEENDIAVDMFGDWHKHVTNAIKSGKKYVFDYRVYPELFLYLLSKHFDLFGLIESNQALDKTKLP